jgi:hypothetical protein
MISTTIAFLITSTACIATYIWGMRQVPSEKVISTIIDALKDGGYVKTRIDENGEEEFIRLDD